MSETMELTTKGKENLSRVVALKKEEILSVAAANVRAMGETFFTSAMLTILSNPDTERLMTTSKGVQTALKAMTDAAQVGIFFGGPAPMAYFVPKDGGLLMVKTAAGVRHAACYGPGAILSTVPELVTVRENDGFKIDPASGVVSYANGGFDPFSPGRGEVVGYFMRLQYKDGRPDVLRHVTLKKVQALEAAYSMTGGPAFKKSPDEMHEAKATKYLLRDVFAECAGLAKMVLESQEDGIDLGPDYDPETGGYRSRAPRPAPRDITERVVRQAERAVETLKPEASVEPGEDIVVEVVEDEAQGETTEAGEAGDATGDGDELFR